MRLLILSIIALSWPYSILADGNKWVAKFVFPTSDGQLYEANGEATVIINGTKVVANLYMTSNDGKKDARIIEGELGRLPKPRHNFFGRLDFNANVRGKDQATVYGVKYSGFYIRRVLENSGDSYSEYGLEAITLFDGRSYIVLVQSVPPR